MDNLETLATQGARHRTKTNKTITQHTTQKTKNVSNTDPATQTKQFTWATHTTNLHEQHIPPIYMSNTDPAIYMSNTDHQFVSTLWLNLINNPRHLYIVLNSETPWSADILYHYRVVLLVFNGTFIDSSWQ